MIAQVGAEVRNAVNEALSIIRRMLAGLGAQDSHANISVELAAAS